jgi:DNA replication protein
VTTRGFPDGSRTTPLPDLLFSRYLPDLADAGVIKVLLHVCWRIYRRVAGTPPALAEGELAGDETLVRGLGAVGVAPGDAVAAVGAALDRLVAIGLLLEACVPGTDAPARWIFVNGREGRAALARWQANGLVLDPSTVSAPAAPPVRRDIFVLYEQNIGLVTPLLAEELADAEATYPPEWIADAMRLAVANNARKWAYVRAILQRWAREGRDDGTDRGDPGETRARDSEGPYGAWIRH